MSEFYIKCWNCKKPVTLEARRENDGDCTNCQSELDLECYLESADDIHQGLLAERVILLQEIERLKAKLELSMQAIHFYSSQTSYSGSWVISDRTPIHAMEDKGRVAKNALAAIEKLEGKGDE